MTGKKIVQISEKNGIVLPFFKSTQNITDTPHKLCGAQMIRKLI